MGGPALSLGVEAGEAQDYWAVACLSSGRQCGSCVVRALGLDLEQLGVGRVPNQAGAPALPTLCFILVLGWGAAGSSPMFSFETLKFLL